MRQAGIIVALGSAVVVNSGSHFRWIVSRNAVDGVGENPKLKKVLLSTLPCLTLQPLLLIQASSLCVLYKSQNTQQICPYGSFTDLSL